MGRSPCCDKANVKKGPWSPEEDAKLKQYIKKNGACGNWISLPQKAGLRRCGKSCRLRWLNYLRPNIKHGEFSCEEDRVICTLFAAIGSRWSIIASHLPGRTDNDIKNYWNTKLKKKLMSTGLAPHHNHQYPSHVQKPSLQSSFPSNPCQNPSLPSLFAENYNNLNPLCMTSTAPASTLDFTSAVPNFSNDNPSSSSVTTENSLLMNPSVYYPVKDNMLLLGSEGSSNSSSEHCIKQETVMDFHNYFVGSRNEVQPSLDDDDQGFVGTGYGFQGSDQANNFWANKLENANFGENVLKYDIEDVKKLIHSSTDVLRTPSSASAKVEDEEKDMFFF